MPVLDYVQMYERHIEVEVTDEQFAILKGPDSAEARTAVIDAAHLKQDVTPLKWQWTLVVDGDGEEVFYVG